MSELAAQIVSGLPDNPSFALFEIHRRVQQLLDRGSLAEDRDFALIITIIRAWHQRYQTEIRWTIPKFTNDTTVYQDLLLTLSSIKKYEESVERDLTAERVNEILDIEERVRRKETFGIAVLTDDEKSKIREHISRIRECISESELSDHKKAALFSRLGQLETEIETVGTRTDRFFAFLGDAAFVVGDMAEKAKPFTSEVKEMMKIIYRRREDAEGVRLPKRADELLLPPPEA